MGNTGSASGKTKNCNSCSHGSNYFSFGKVESKSLYKNHIVYTDSKGRYIKVKGKNGIKKQYLPKGARVTTKKKYPVKKKSPVKKKYYKRNEVKSPSKKTVKNIKGKKIGYRLSARTVYNELGTKGLNKSYPILQKDGTYKNKILRLRQNGSPYFSNKFGKTNQLVHLNIPINKNWLRGPTRDEMTGLKKSWPNNTYMIAPSGVNEPLQHKHAHLHYGKMCFGA